VAEVDAAWALAQCIAGEKAAMGSDKRVTNSEGATWSRTLGATAFATSGGFAGGYRGSYASFVVEPLCDDDSGGGDPKKRNGHYWTADRFLAALEDPEAVGREATRRTVATLGSRKIDTQECAIVFDPDVARTIVGTLIGVANGSAFWRKSTYLLGREGTLVASPLVHLVDDPHVRRGPGSRPFDGDGLPTRKNLIVEDGVLRTVICDTYAARQARAHVDRLGRPGRRRQSGAHHVERAHAARHAVARRHLEEHGPRPLRHQPHGLRLQPSHRRLLARRAGVLDRGRRADLPGQRDHDLGQLRRDHEAHRRRGRRPRSPLVDGGADDPRVAHDGRGAGRRG
jgi:hypothetical protein